MLYARELFFFFNDTATTEIYTLSLHDALPIWGAVAQRVDDVGRRAEPARAERGGRGGAEGGRGEGGAVRRSEEHTSELQSRQYLVCRLLLEKKNKITNHCCYSLSKHTIVRYMD